MARKRIRHIGLIGCGNIGGVVLEILQRHGDLNVSILSRSSDPPRGFSRASTLDAFLQAKPDIVIECAGQEAFAELASKILREGFDLVPASVGALASPPVWASCREAASRGGTRVLLPSGAISGIDAIAGAQATGDLIEVIYTQYATWDALGLNPHDDATRGAPKRVFAGTAREASIQFPHNANVASLIALAGLGFDRTKVEIHAQSDLVATRHRIDARTSGTTMASSTINTPLRSGARSSRQVAGSLVATALYGAQEVRWS